MFPDFWHAVIFNRPSLAVGLKNSRILAVFVILKPSSGHAEADPLLMSKPRA
jgi:hypothetical protein